MSRIKLFAVVTVLFTLIFSQLWVSAYACAVAGRAIPTDAGALAVMLTGSHADLQDPHTAASCHLHCNNSAQPDHANLPTVSPAVWLPLIWGHSSIVALAVRPDRPTHPEPILLSAPPPSRILFQVFRT
ncbi:hypothetical protein [Paraburkholderia megapolitana]|uniref:hypothetical protein n=1 Tax=Paraburkholderia megapolitana TaxID=420953 RepID=UPI0038B954AA